MDTPNDTTLYDDDRTEDPRCSFCNATLAEDGDCDRCQRAWERGEVLA